MCGIAGLLHRSDSPSAAKAAVRRMIRLQRHRGPDGEGFYDTIEASLGHCRLAVLDLTDTGRQPMSDETGRFWITYNGEIYNYRELAHELALCGYRFRGSSDTEVILAAYGFWGEQCVEHFRGMFAFAIWNEETRCLFVARDRFGIKPFHYWTDGESKLAFSSELKALLEFVPHRSPNLRLAREFLAWNLLDHDAEETLVEGIKRLPPAHAMTWNSRAGLKMWRYWSVQFSEQLETESSRRQSMIDEFRSRFDEVISLHLRSDVAVGSCLSGGLDSSAIVCAVSAELQKRGAWRDGGQHTFSACFEETDLDERPFIKAVAEATGCRTHFVFPSGDRMSEDLNNWLWHQEEPIGGSGAYAQYCVARLAREHGIKVLLDGQGADEQLAGYRKFILVYLRQLIKNRKFLTALREGFAFFSSPEILRTSRLVDGKRYLFNSTSEVAQLWPGSRQPDRPSALSLGNSLGRRLEADLTRFSLPVLLRYEDRNTMAFGVESRVPFLDHTFVEWLAALPADMRLARGWTKFILRNALVGVLPERVRQRKSKLGFLTPEPLWLAGPLFEWLNRSLKEPRHLCQVADRDEVHRLLARWSGGDRSLSVGTMLFRLAIYETWAQQFLESHVSSRARDLREEVYS